MIGPGAGGATVDVVVVCWNARDYLPRCLSAVSDSTVPVRILVVDNASTDGSAAWVREERPDVELVALERNLGYAGGANAGLERGSAPYAFIMNPDLLLEPDHLERLVERLEKEPRVGAAQGKLFHVDRAAFLDGVPPPARVLDSAGQSVRRTRMGVDRGQGAADAPPYDRDASVFSACGAGLLLRRAALLDLAPDGPWFDPAFFAYKEDIDLCWRLRLYGWDIRYIAAARAHHVRALPGDDRSAWRRLPLEVRRHSWKNHYLLMMKNDRLKDLLASLPYLLAWETARNAFALLRDPAVLGAWGAVARSAPAALRERRRSLAVARSRGVDLGPWFGRDAMPEGDRP